MKLLVTGGAGFIGANFVHLVVREHPEVDVVVLDKLTYAGNLVSLAPVADRISFVEGDVTDTDLVDGLVSTVDAVVHLAAESHNDNSLSKPAPFVQTNLVGTFTLLEAARRHGVRFHHVSTDEVYGDLELHDQSRFSTASPYRPSSPYSATKAGSDHLVRAWVRSFGLEATISSCSNNYGPYQHVEKLIPRQITGLIDRVRPKVYGRGENVRDWIHVDDHNRAVWEVLTRGRAGETYLIGAEGQASNLEVVRILLDLFGRSPDDLDYVADRPGHDLRYAVDATGLREGLGWEPRFTNLRDGLVSTVDWYRKHEQWWRPQKDQTEARYRALGR